MYFSVSSILLGLVATASAIDIRAHIGSSCAGAYVACVNINPNVCCSFSSSGSSGRSSISVVARADDLSCPAEQPGAGKCEAVVKPDVLGLADGTAYNIADLADEKVQELEKIAETGAGADAVPAEFQTLQIEG
ncbi:hypothetical protein RB213_015752 [Colletotrichum asianum]